MKAWHFLAIGFLLRFLLAIWVQFRGIEVALSNDVIEFYYSMIDVSQSGQFFELSVGPSFIVNLFGLCMMLLGNEPIVPCILASVVWLLSAILFYKTACAVGCTPRTLLVLCILYGLWPTAIYYTAIPLRECFQLLFVNLIIFGATMSLVSRTQAYWPLIIIGLVGAGAQHGALSAYAAFALLASISAVAAVRTQKISTTLGVSLLLGAFLFYFGISVFSSLTYDVSDGLFNAVEKYQAGGTSLISRADYRTEVSSFQGLSFLISLPAGLIQYLFEPFPNRVQNISDGLLLFENVLRLMVIVWGVIAAFREENFTHKVYLTYLLALYFSQEALWSLGTVNWGTAARHHVPAMGVLLLIAMQTKFLNSKTSLRASRNNSRGPATPFPSS